MSGGRCSSERAAPGHATSRTQYRGHARTAAFHAKQRGGTSGTGLCDSASTATKPRPNFCLSPFTETHQRRSGAADLNFFDCG